MADVLFMHNDPSEIPVDVGFWRIARSDYSMHTPTTYGCDISYGDLRLRFMATIAYAMCDYDIRSRHMATIAYPVYDCDTANVSYDSWLR